MKRSRLLALAVLLCLPTTASRASVSRAEGGYAVEAETEIFTMEKIYPSMFGPADTDRVTLLPTGQDDPELLWITAVRSDMVGADGETPESPEYFCHSVVARHGQAGADQLQELRALGISVQNRKLFTLVQGLNEIRFPPGFGIPVFSNDRFDIQAMAMNPSEPVEPVRVGVDSRVEFVRASEVDREMKPLFVVTLVLRAPLRNADDVHASHASHEGHEGHEHAGGETCLDADVPTSIVRPVERFASDSHEATGYTGHWYVPPGRHVYRHRIGPLRGQIPFDTTVHYIASHLHPYGESLALIDVTTGETVFEARARNYPDRVAVEEVTYYASPEGFAIDRSHEYELAATYENPTDHDVDAMAVMYLYLHDSLGTQEAGGFLGADENIHCLADVAITGVRGESLCLAHKTTGHYAVAGVYLSDDGYALGVKGDGSGDPETYYPLTEQEIAEYQAKGMLPSPLPGYSIPLGDYLMGYSLWLILAGGALVWLIVPARPAAKRGSPGKLPVPSA